MKIVRIVLAGVIGYFFGFQLAECSKSYGQTRQNEQVHLNSYNTVLLRGIVDPESTQKAQLELAKLVTLRLFKPYPIYLVLDSPGGDVEAGIQMIEFAKAFTNVHTVTIFAASMAADTVEGMPGRRLITNNGSLMFHRAKGGFQGQFEVGEVESRLAMAKKMILSLELVNSSRMGISLIEYKARIKDEWWMNADEAIQFKAADKIIDIVCSQELIDQKIKSKIDTMFGSYNVVYSACPAFRSPLIVETIKELLEVPDKTKTYVNKELNFNPTSR